MADPKGMAPVSICTCLEIPSALIFQVPGSFICDYLSLISSKNLGHISTVPSQEIFFLGSGSPAVS